MFIGQTFRRMFRRGTKKHTYRRAASRWDRCRLSLTPLEDRRVPATITVTGNGDNVASDGSCTLREAIQSIMAASDFNADVTANITGTYGNDSIIFNGAMTIS